MKPQIELGLLFSRSGSYTLISDACRSGALADIAALNATSDCAVEFVPVERDPRGNVDLYGPMCTEILNASRARHVIGCVTSWSRKEDIPTLKNYGGTLWYPVPHEGFEAPDHVVYTHACPNQHLLPLLDWAMHVHGARAYLVGSNCIWGWEINRLARETVLAADIADLRRLDARQTFVRAVALLAARQVGNRRRSPGAADGDGVAAQFRRCGGPGGWRRYRGTRR